MRNNDLEKRFILFSVSIIKLAEDVKQNRAGQYLADQLIRSSVSSSLNYAEVYGAESLRDFIHKLKISLKELNESRNNLQIILHSGLCENKKNLNDSLDECSQLIAILVSSIKTAQKK